MEDDEEEEETQQKEKVQTSADMRFDRSMLTSGLFIFLLRKFGLGLNDGWVGQQHTKNEFKVGLGVNFLI